MSELPITEGVHDNGRAALGVARSPYASSYERADAPPTRLRIADALLGVSLLGGVIIVGNLDGDRMPHGVQEFLAIRVTIKNVLLLTAFGLVWPAVLSACGLYSPARLRSGTGDWPRLLLASAIGCFLAMVFSLTSTSGAFRPELAWLFAAAVLLSTAVLRGAARAVQLASRGKRQQQIVIVGSGPLAARMHRELQADSLQAGEVIGFVDSEPHPALGSTGAMHLGGVSDLERILMHRVVDDVFIGLPVKSRYDEIRQSIAACARVGVPASYSSDLFGGGPSNARLNSRGAPVLSLSETPSADRLAIKRAIDLVGALVLLVTLAPLMLGIAVGIKLTSRGPVLFTQNRYGYMKRLFRMYKFRTMVAGAESAQHDLEGRNEASGPVFKIRDDPRIAPFGRFLRRTSLDELPQLWNVLTGEMSLVGPRPLPVRDVGRFAEPWLMRRFSMPPGLTCLWQISGRSDLGFEQWIALDMEYLDRWSLALDLEILLRTVPAVLRGRGAK
jgi:exopolysaccharide biosynthesis polyprenyl glycosylphosphotransferase